MKAIGEKAAADAAALEAERAKLIASTKSIDNGMIEYGDRRGIDPGTFRPMF